ncbi:C40 family peptidase [Nocardia sp. NBC_00511]|uniref:C40 family peptidase n=1 Tax=Nocardia sp. NBC_00511 TaxID=2903591 RepID=UPI0030E0365D
MNDSAVVDTRALAAPIERLLAGFGDGGAVTTAESLRAASESVEGVSTASRSGVNRVYDSWRGVGGDAAMDKGLRTQTSATNSAERGRKMADIVERADGEVAAGRQEVAGILREFRGEIAAFEAGGMRPAGVTALVESAVEHLGQAVRVVERVQTALDEESAAMRELATPAPGPVSQAGGDGSATPVSVRAAGVDSDGAGTVPRTADGGAQAATTVRSGSSRSSDSGAWHRLVTTPASLTSSHSSHRSHGSTPHAQEGGVKVTLPDGSTVEAPNQRAADAVRNALSAVGTPYVWGGVTPGVGLDCSGLTQWAYAQAGVSLPRLAQEQGYGHPRIGPGDLMPGDLAVWDGHVAMVIGNGQLVEAGDPVQVGPIRTQNSGMRFLGFYRPTA